MRNFFMLLSLVILGLSSDAAAQNGYFLDVSGVQEVNAGQTEEYSAVWKNSLGQIVASPPLQEFQWSIQQSKGIIISQSSTGCTVKWTISGVAKLEFEYSSPTTYYLKVTDVTVNPTYNLEIIGPGSGLVGAKLTYTASWTNELGQAVSPPNYSEFVWNVQSATILSQSSSSCTIEWISPGTPAVELEYVTSTAYFFDSRNISVTDNAQVLPNSNLIITNTLLVPGKKNISEVNGAQAHENIRNILYYDGLGRVTQEVAYKYSPLSRDVVLPRSYDQFGLESVKYLPYVSGDNGYYKESAIKVNGEYVGSEHQFFYSETSTRIARDIAPFSVSVREQSPLHRIIKQGMPGTSWQPDNDESYNSSDRTLKKSYEFNQAYEVLQWTYTSPTEEYTATSQYAFGSFSAGTVSSPVYYPANQLFRNKTKDEQGNQVIEYTNKQGQVILKRVQVTSGNPSTTGANKDTDYASTYYIYDDFGRLVCVIPPEAIKRLATEYYHAASDATSKNKFLKNWGFRYRYDARGRMIMKQVPGAEPVFMIYDNRDRLVLTQDGNLRKTYAGADLMKWAFTKYDHLNRPVLTGIYVADSVLNMTAMQERVNRYYAQLATNGGAWYESFSLTGPIHGYDNLSFPTTVPADDYLTVTYYDNYNFKSLFTSATTSEFDFKSGELPASGNLSGQVTTFNNAVRGLPTGAKVRSITAATWMKSVTYYDAKYLPVQMIAQNMKGHAVTTSVFDFTGKVLRTKTSTYTGQPVTWTNLINCQTQGKDIYSVSGGTWAAGASSVQILPANTDGWVEYTISNRTPSVMVGLSDQDVGAHYSTIDYGFFVNGNNLYAYEGSSPKWTSSYGHSGDRLRVERVGNKIHFKRNGFIVYTSTTPSTSALVMDISFSEVGGRISDARISETFQSFVPVPRTIVQRNDYDHAGRLIRNWHQIDSQPEVLLVHNTYNELGQLIDKRLHSSVSTGSDARQSVDYRYNIRGWLTSINNAELDQNACNDDDTDFFGMNLAYEQDLGTGNANANPSFDLRQYNGNISSMKWSHRMGAADVKEYGYNFAYDPLNRLKHARSVKNSNLSTPQWVTGEFHERNITYDLNGNIMALSRNGKDGLIDSLTYNYGSGLNNVTNKLLYLFDYAPNTTVKRQGFLDGNTAGNDYSYDPNGNLLTDKNKGIANQMTYNHLNLVETLIKSTASMRYFYDATGSKYAQLMTQGNSWKLTEYIGPYVFVNDQLEFIQHAEGRIIYKSSETIYRHDFDNTTNVTPTADITLTNEVVNEETYLKVTAANGVVLTKKGVTPIGGSIPVTPGEKYTLRVKGYRTNYPVHLYVKGTTDLVWAGAALAAAINNENWGETSFIAPQGLTAVEVGVLWNSSNTLTDAFYLNELELVHHINEAPEYQYHLKDHLGNVRLTFTTKQEVLTDTATFEPPRTGLEQSKFLRYANAKRVNSALFDRTNGNATGYSERLNGSTNEKYGLAKSLAVMPGDTINMEVFAKYVDTNPANWTTALNDLIGQINASAMGVVVDGVNYSNSTSTFPYAGVLNTGGSSSNGPKAYLNWLVYDRDFNLITGGFKRMTDVAKETGQDVAHEQLTGQIVVKEPGYVYIYLSNEETTPVDVFFDDFKVEHIKSPVIQIDDYYPFGLKFSSYSRENSVPNKNKLFQGQEHIDDLGLNWDAFKWRNHQPDIGRFFNIDPIAEKYYYNSPYAFSENRVIDGRELEGLEWESINNDDGTQTRRLTIQLINSSNLSEKKLDKLITEMQAAFAKTFSDGNADAELVVQKSTEAMGPYQVTLKDTKSFSVIDRNTGQVAGKTYEGGKTAILGGTKYNSYSVTATVDGKARASSLIVRSFLHESGHAVGLEHPWSATNLITDITQGGAGVSNSTVKNNLMNSDQNTNASLRSASGTSLTPGQFSQIDQNIAPTTWDLGSPDQYKISEYE